MTKRPDAEVSSQTHLRAFADLLPDPYCLLDESGAIILINQVGKKVLGVENVDIEGKSLTNILESDAAVRFQTRYPELITEDRVSNLVLTVADTDRDPVIISCNISPEHDERDQFTGAHCLFRDVTGERKQKRDLERFRTLLNQSYDGIFIIDANDFNIVDANDTICEWLGYSREEILSMHPWDIETTMSDPAVWPGGLERLSHVENMIFEGENRRKDGSTFPVEVRLSLVSLERDYVVSQVRDITERLKRERELEAAIQQLRESNEKLNEFAGMVSHDLRNPLTVAEGRLQLARQKCDSEHLDGVFRAHDRIGNLISDLLTLARDGKTIETTEWIGFKPLIESCWDVAETANATLITEIDCRIRADQSRLQQLLENLIRNAVDHGRSDVTISIGEFEDGFYVADDGPGIPETDRDQIFENGYTTSQDGTGFGLAIVQGIAHAHGWKITLDETRDNGACFEITGVELGH